MTLTFSSIVFIIVGAVVYAAFVPRAGRAWVLFIGSLIGIYMLQPALPIRFSDFILPSITVGLVIACWVAVRGKPFTRGDAVALGLAALTVMALALNRYLEAGTRITPSRPPDTLAFGIGMGIFALLLAGFALFARMRPRAAQFGLIGVIIGLFLVTKMNVLGASVSGIWRGATEQDVSLAGLIDLNWLGFSYVAFRLIHTLRDRQSGILPPMGARDYLLYVLFFPAYTAGPIDRAERFQEDTAALPTMARFDADRFARGLGRIIMGMVKKFAIADTLAFGASLTAANAVQAESAIGLWALLFGYGLRLFFDFSGYTDIAIGIGILFGFQLPENFNRPYFKTSITAFWQSWHMTLSNWARFYLFSPITRGLLRREPKPPSALILFTGHLVTMTVIGLWHGVTPNFLVWGVWHGLGLFAHKQWSNRTRKAYRAAATFPMRRRAWALGGWMITILFVMLGWVWFALPFEIALPTFGKLFGLGG